jgi:hypothetical protein
MLSGKRMRKLFRRSHPKSLFPLLTLLLLAANPRAVLAAPAAKALPANVMRVADVRAGMTGYGLTVFEGTKVEKFAVRVVSVVPSFLPGMDVILIYCDDPRVKYAGITAGMSGSPIYLDGKLAGALAYGWAFHKDPIAGVTPMEYMIDTARRPLRGPEASPIASAERRTESDRALARLDADAEPTWWRRFALPALPGRSQLRAPEGAGPAAHRTLERVAVPLAVSGFGSQEADDLARALGPYGLEVLTGGGGGTKARLAAGAPAGFEPGGAIGVQLVRGDMSAASTGTVSWIDGNTVAAFGHPMFGTGETYLPVTTAFVHTFINSNNRSFKLASPIAEAGSLVQDRQACIVADTTRKAEMIPVSVTVRTRSGEQTFNAEVARHRFLTPLLVGMAVGNALSALAPDVTDVTAEIRSHLHITGHKPLELTDNLYSPEGLGPRAVTAIGALRALSMILFNPFDRVRIERVTIRADIDYKADYAQVTGLRLSTDELEPGSRVNLQVLMLPYGKPEYVENIPIEIPRRLAGQSVRIDVAAGQTVRPDLPAPVNLRGYIDGLRRSYSSRTLVVTIQTPDEGAMIRGKVVPDLPSSELDTLRPSTATARSTSFRPGARIIHEARRVVTGQTSIQVRVKDEVL